MILGKHIHLFTVACVYSLHLIESVEAHSGYQFSWSPLRVLPFFTDEEYHDFHHSHNVGNYSEIWLWDTFFGTNREYYKYLHLKRKAIEKVRNDGTIKVAELNKKLLTLLREEERNSKVYKID